MRKTVPIGRGLMTLVLLVSLLTTFGGGMPVAAKSSVAEAIALGAVRDSGVLAVATDYGWSETTGTYTEITGGTQVTTSCDDTSYSAQSLPFTFTFDGTDYTQFSINCNGFIAIGPTVSSSYSPISGGTSNNVISGLGGDQQTNTTGSEIRYETLGTAPDQVLVIQWKNFRHYGATGDLYNYQIRLHETSNVVEVIYGTFTQNTTNRTSQIGLRGASNADFSNRTSTGDWTASTSGATNSATMALTSVYIPPSGLTWTWTPLEPHPVLNSSYKTAPAQAVVGDPIAYSVHIINSGNSPAAAATLVDPIPTGTTYNGDVACSAGTCSYNGGLNQIEWTGAISVSAAVTITFSVDTDGMACGSVVVNEATLDDPDLFEDSVVKTASTSLVSATPAPLEGFEVSVPPAGWTETIVYDPGTDPDWSQVSAGTYPTINPHGGSYMAKFNSYNTGAGGSARLWTSALDLSAYIAPQVVFWMSHDTGYSGNADRIQIQVSTDGVTWVDVGAPVLRYDATCATACWKEHAVPLPAGYNINGVYIGFLGISGYGNNFYLDNTALSEGWYPCPYVSLTPDASKTACPGCSVEYVLTLTNMTPDADTFDIAASGNAWSTTLNPSQLALGPGASGGISATVEVSCDTGTDVATITAMGQTHGGTDSVTLTTSGAMAYWEQIATEPDNGRMDNVTGAWDGKVWSITGYGANLNVRSYDPATGSWTVVGTPPTFAGNYAHSGCQAGSKVYIYGDTSTTGFTGLWSYDMATTTWAQETPTGDAPPHTGIWAPAWAYDAETGICYLTGGATASGAGTLATVYAYDTVANAWLAPLPDFTSVRDFHAAWVFTDSTARKLLCVAGGNNGAGMTSTQCYDFVAGAWGVEDADMGPLPASLWGMGYAQKVHEGVTQLWVIGGVRADVLTPVTSFFDVMADVWADDGDLASAPIYRSSAVTLDNVIYHIGGSTGSFSYTGLADRHVQCTGCVLPPNIVVDPLSLNATQLSGAVTQQTLTISNTGEADLTWQVLEEPLAVARNVVPSGTSRVSAIALTGSDDGALPAVSADPQADSPAAIAAEESGIDTAGTPVIPQSVIARDPVARANARRLLFTTGLLLIPDSTADSVMAFDPLTGDLVDANFIPSDPDHLSTPKNAILSSSGNSILVADQVDDVVQEYDLDGNYIGVFAPAGGANLDILDNVLGIDLLPNGHLLVPVDSGANEDSVAEFDTGGAYLGNFIANGSGGLDGPFDIYPRANDWLVTSINTDNVLRYDLTGAYLDVFAPDVVFGEQIAGASNGNVLVANFSTPNTGVMEFTSAGALVGVYSVVSGNRGVYELPNGNILTTSGAGVFEIDRSNNLVSTKYTGTGSQYIEYVVLPTACTNLADVPWLSTSPISGTTPAGAITAVDVTFDSTGLAPGTYTANLCIESNDPDVGPGNETGLVVVPLELTVQAASIVLTKTVGTVDGVCATTDDITVMEGTTVYYCYTVANTGDVTLNLHDLVDDHLGTIFSGLNYVLTPGSSVNTVAAGLSIPAVMNVTTVNTATWTAYDANGPSVTATDRATVTVELTPNIDVDPLSLSSTQAPDVTTSQTLDIANTGEADLTWEILEEPGVVLRSAAGGKAPRAALTGATGSRGGTAGGAAPRTYLSMADFIEGFDDITLLPGLGWFFQNNSSPLGLTDWFQGNDAVFPAQAGAVTAYIGANYNNTSGVGAISNWMLTPEISLADGDTISFWTRVPTGSAWPDRLEVRLSTNGASTNVGTLATDVGDFTTLLVSVNPTLVVGGYPDVWTQYSVNLSGIPVGATGRVAFRYFVENGGPSGSASNYIGIDTVEYVGAQALCAAPEDVPWLSTAPITGTTVGGATTPVDVAFDSTGLVAGTYTANLCVESNDPDAGPGNGTSLVVVPVTLTVTQVLTPSIVLTKTVGTVDGVCATTDDITVMEGTTVYYCYTVANTGDVTLNLHDLVDDQLGTIFLGLNYALTPGSSVNTVAAGLSIPAVMNATTVNTATWTAYNATGGPVATATDTARVTVTPSAVGVSGLRASAAGGWSSIALLGALALGGVAWRRRRR